MEPRSYDLQAMRIWTILAILGALLLIAGWYRFAT
jgi:hypothetical protein